VIRLATLLFPALPRDAGAAWAAPLPEGLEAELVPAPYVSDQALDMRFAPGPIALLSNAHVVLWLRAQASTDEARLAQMEAAGRALNLLCTATDAPAVIIHGAGEVAYPIAEIRRRTTPHEAPFTHAFVWIDVGTTPPAVWTMGLATFGLPEIYAHATGRLDEDERHARGVEAVLTAVNRMALERHVWAEGDELVVPPGIELGGHAPSYTNIGLEWDGAPRWRASVQGDARLIEPVRPLAPLAEAWAAAAEPGAEPLPYPAYKHLYLRALTSHGTRLIHTRAGRHVDGIPPYEVLVLQRLNGEYLLTTCGMGRLAQPGGQVEEDNAFIELVIVAPAHDADLADMLGIVGFAVHGKGPGAPPIGVFHRVGQRVTPRWPYEFVVMGWSTRVELGAGPPVCLYLPALMSRAERDATQLGDNAAWIEREAPRWRPRWLGSVQA
jgi:hypothetical protein